MDIWLFIFIIVLQGVFFFLNSWSKSFNPMFFVIILSLLGLFFLIQEPVEIIDYSAVVSNSTHAYHPNVNVTDYGIGGTSVVSFFYLVYIFNLFMGIFNLVWGSKDEK